jgi:UDP-GlcNAc:undecaprenyl-phosphate GlcNAc-1-phosphate transferase
LAFFPSLLLSLWLTPVAIRYSFRLNAVDYPSERKVHKKAVSRMGGAAMVAGLVLPLVFTPLDRTVLAFLAGAFLVSATGFLDDVYRIPPLAKFVGEIAAAAAFVLLSGLSIKEFGDLFSIGEISTGRFGPFLTIFCMVGVMNALNLSDGLDGLAGGISAIACAFLGLFAYLGLDWAPVMILVALLGSLFGFLRYNTYPANLFMGDTGSLLLGYTLSAVAVLLVQNGGAGIHLSPVTVAAVLALPITDTLLVMARRIVRGRGPFLGDRTHLHHRLLALGIPHAAVVPILYAGTGAFGVQAWMLRSSPDWVQFGAVVLLAILVHGVVFVLHRVGYRWQRTSEAALSSSLSRSGSSLAKDPAYGVMAKVMGKSVRVVAWAIGIGLAVPILALPAVPHVFGGIAVAAILFTAAMFPWRSHDSRPSVCHGLMYFACICLLAILQVSPGSPPWVPSYLAALSAVVLAWVLLKMKYRGHREIVAISSFEMLLLGIALFISLVLVPALGLGAGLRRTLLTVCMESAAFLLAMKILIRRQPRRNYMIAAGFLAALALIAAKEFLPKRIVADLVAAPVVVWAAGPVVPGSASLRPPIADVPKTIPSSRR